MDTMDFVKRAWATLDLSSPFAPTLSVEELDKRITDLRAVEQWLAINQGMLRNTIQGLEIQRGTLAAVQGLSESFGRMARGSGEDTAEALARFAAAAATSATAPAAPDAVAPGAAATSGAATSGTAAPAGADAATPAAAALPPWTGGVDPLAWWKVLQGNFEQIARMASGTAQAAAGPPAGRVTPRSKPAGKAAPRAGTKPAARRKGRKAADGRPTAPPRNTPHESAEEP